MEENRKQNSNDFKNITNDQDRLRIQPTSIWDKMPLDSQNSNDFKDIDDSQEKLHLRLSFMWKRKTEKIPITKKEIEGLTLISLILYVFISTGIIFLFILIIQNIHIIFILIDISVLIITYVYLLYNQHKLRKKEKKIGYVFTKKKRKDSKNIFPKFVLMLSTIIIFVVVLIEIDPLILIITISLSLIYIYFDQE